MFDLAGKNALVTGASGGIGRAIAAALSEAGAKVALVWHAGSCARRSARVLGGRRGSCVPCNLSDPEAVSGLVASAEEAVGPLDIIVANAGVTRDGLLMRMKDEDWNDVININLGAYFRIVKSAMRGMMKRRSGRIIGITSIVGVTGNPGQANYCASKAGMIGFTKSVAQEVASRGITANCIAPGFIESPMTDVLPDAQKEALLGQIPANRLGVLAI